MIIAQRVALRVEQVDVWRTAVPSARLDYLSIAHHQNRHVLGVEVLPGGPLDVVLGDSLDLRLVVVK